MRAVHPGDSNHANQSTAEQPHGGGQRYDRCWPKVSANQHIIKVAIGIELLVVIARHNLLQRIRLTGTEIDTKALQIGIVEIVDRRERITAVA